MERYEELKEMLRAELKHIAQKGELNMQTLEQADKLAHTLKCIVTVEAMEDGGGYSEHYPMPYRGYYDDGGAYARGRGPAARRDSMGRYSSEMRRGGSYDDGESMDSYRSR